MEQPATVIVSQVDTQEQNLVLLRKKLPATPWASLKKSAVPGILEAKTENGKTFYIDDKINYMFVGTVINLNTGKFLEASSELPN